MVHADDSEPGMRDVEHERDNDASRRGITSVPKAEPRAREPARVSFDTIAIADAKMTTRNTVGSYGFSREKRCFDGDINHRVRRLHGSPIGIAAVGAIRAVTRDRMRSSRRDKTRAPTTRTAAVGAGGDRAERHRHTGTAARSSSPCRSSSTRVRRMVVPIAFDFFHHDLLARVEPRRRPREREPDEQPGQREDGPLPRDGVSLRCFIPGCAPAPAELVPKLRGGRRDEEEGQCERAT